MARKTMYQIVGRYMRGAEVTGYHLQSIENGKSKKYTREQVCWLVGRGQVTNCEGQLYQDKVLLRGIGVSLEDLPVQQESGEIQRANSVHNIRKSDTGTDVMTKLFITQSITDGRNVVGYVVTNSGGGTANLSRAQVLELAKDGKLGNASFQTSNGKPILRGVGINLNELPSIKVNTPNEAVPIAQDKAQSKVRSGIGALSSVEETVPKRVRVVDGGGYELVKKAGEHKVSGKSGESTFKTALKNQLPTGIKLENMFISNTGNGYFDVNILVRQLGMGIGYVINTNTLTKTCNNVYCSIPNAPYNNSEGLQNISYNFSDPTKLCKKIVKEIVDSFIKAGV